MARSLDRHGLFSLAADQHRHRPFFGPLFGLGLAAAFRSEHPPSKKHQQEQEKDRQYCRSANGAPVLAMWSGIMAD